MGQYEQVSLNLRFFLISQGIFQFLMAVFVTSTIWLMANNRDWQNVHTWHVFLSTTGFSLCMALGVSVLNPGNTFILGSNRPFRTLIHIVLMAIAGLMAIVGISIKIDDKRKRGSSHFVSDHAILGLTAYLLTFVTMIGGVPLLFVKLLFKMCNLKPVLLKKIHMFIGMAAYAIGTASLCLGLRNYFGEASYNTTTGLIVILVIYTCLNLFGALKSLFS